MIAVVALKVFAMDNLDWKRKTLEGGTFNATTAIIVKNVTSDEDARRISSTTIPRCFISAR